jgi:hypothetical protein
VARVDVDFNQVDGLAAMQTFFSAHRAARSDICKAAADAHRKLHDPVTIEPSIYATPRVARSLRCLGAAPAINIQV